MLPMVASLPASGGFATHYVLPVLWVKPRFLTVGTVEACRYRCSDAAAALCAGFMLTTADAASRRVRGAGGGVCDTATELYILCWSELGRRKLSPMLATAYYSCPDNAIGLVAQCELSGYVKLG